MSQWTHIRGCLELVSNPHEFKGKNPNVKFGSKAAYLPYPEEQVKISAPRPYSYLNDKNEVVQQLDFRCYIFSLPRAKKYIEEALEMIPLGESGLKYSIHQDIEMSMSSSSEFDYPCDEKAFKAAVEKMYTGSSFTTYTFEELEEYFFDAQLERVEDVNHILIGIRDDICCCSGQMVQEGLEQCMRYLYKNDIRLEDGYLEWEDECEYRYYWAFRHSRISDDCRCVFSFYKIDYETNKIIWEKNFLYPLIKDAENEYDIDFGNNDFVTTESSKNDVKYKNENENEKAVFEKTNDETPA